MENFTIAAVALRTGTGNSSVSMGSFFTASCAGGKGHGIQLTPVLRETVLMIDAESDQTLLAAVTQGDRTALAELYDRHASAMLAVAVRIVPDHRDAEDLLHDVFLEAWQKAKQYNADRGTVRTWLLIRTRSRAIDRVRALTLIREHGMAQADLANLDPSATQTSPDPSSAPDLLRARHALGGLPQAQRTVIELGYFEGLSCQEIATRCQIPVGTVKSRLSAAIMKLRQEFTPLREAD